MATAKKSQNSWHVRKQKGCLCFDDSVQQRESHEHEIPRLIIHIRLEFQGGYYLDENVEQVAKIGRELGLSVDDELAF